MTKKDRIAIVATAIYLFLPISAAMGGDAEFGVLALSPVVVYWGYRFIRGDISFLGSSNDEESS